MVFHITRQDTLSRGGFSQGVGVGGAHRLCSQHFKMPRRAYGPTRYGPKQTRLTGGTAARAQNGGFRRSMAVGRARGATAAAATVFNETKYFDTGIFHAVSWAGTDWSDSEVPCDNFVNGSGTAAAYTDSCLLPTAIGSAYGEVNGNRYKLKKIRVRGTLVAPVAMNAADMLTAVNVRLMLIHDEQPNGAQAQGEDIMQDVGSVGENLFSYKRVASSSGRFRILKDNFITLQPATAGTDGTNTNSLAFETAHFSFQYQPNSPILVNVKSGSATPTIASTINCNMFLILAGTRGGAAVSITIAAASRAYYVD